MSLAFSSQNPQQLSKVRSYFFHCFMPPGVTWSVTGHQTVLIAILKLLMKRCFSAAFAYLSGSARNFSFESALDPRYVMPLYSHVDCDESEGVKYTGSRSTDFWTSGIFSLSSSTASEGS